MSLVSSANQYTPDQRQQLCWDEYLKGVINGQPNAYKAALSAGYSKDQALNITIQGWFKAKEENLKVEGMLSKAERNLDQMLDLKTEQPILINKELVVDDNGNAVEVTNPALLRTKADVTMFVAERLGKKKYSQRNESVVVDINLKDIIDAKQVKRIARRILNGNPKGEGKSD